MAGNRLGPRTRVIYESDETGTAYILTIDESFVVAGAGQGDDAPDEYDPAAPPEGIDVSPAPKRFKPRIVYAQSASGDAVKRIVCCNADSDLYSTGTPSAVVIDGETFTTTGRRGEKLTF
jgi:hypothetical protein